MRKTDITDKGLLRVSELSKVTGVSLPTIHYYVREGLLFPSTKTARNMAYYSPDCVDDIRLIKELQSKNFLPLSVIKLIVQAKHDGQDIEHLIEMRTLFDDIFHPIGIGKSKRLTMNELINSTGLSATEIKALESMGLLMPTETAQGGIYDDIDVRIARIVKGLAEFGLKPADLSVYSQYVEAIRNEAKTMHSKIHEAHGADKVPVSRLMNTLNDLKVYLAKKVYQQTTLEMLK